MRYTLSCRLTAGRHEVLNASELRGSVISTKPRKRRVEKSQIRLRCLHFGYAFGRHDTIVRRGGMRCWTFGEAVWSTRTLTVLCRVGMALLCSGSRYTPLPPTPLPANGEGGRGEGLRTPTNHNAVVSAPKKCARSSAPKKCARSASGRAGTSNIIRKDDPFGIFPIFQSHRNFSDISIPSGFPRRFNYKDLLDISIRLGFLNYACLRFSPDIHSNYSRPTMMTTATATAAAMNTPYSTYFKIFIFFASMGR